MTHPLFGIGPGCFPLVDSGWVVAHNTYTELAAEAGFPALILFLMAMGAAFKNLKHVRESQQYRDDPEFRLWTDALRAGILAFMVGACFGSIEYDLYSYILVAYTCSMLQIVGRPFADYEKGGKNLGLGKGTYDRLPRPQPVWSH